jgi:hypothetical protein
MWRVSELFKSGSQYTIKEKRITASLSVSKINL